MILVLNYFFCNYMKLIIRKVDSMRVDLLRVDLMQSWSGKNWSRGSWSCESWSRVRQFSFALFYTVTFTQTSLVLKLWPCSTCVWNRQKGRGRIQKTPLTNWRLSETGTVQLHWTHSQPSGRFGMSWWRSHKLTMPQGSLPAVVLTSIN